MGSAAVRNPLISILLGALLLRGGLAVALQWQLDHRLHRTFLIEGDASGYWELGRKLARGEPYEIYDPPRRALRMPGYPAFLATAIKLTELVGLDETRAYFIARLLQAIVGTLACALVYKLGKNLFDAQVGLVAAGISAATPTLALFSVELLSETLFAATLLLNLVSMSWLVDCRPTENNSPARGSAALFTLAIVTGALVALACYMRPSWLLFGPCFAAAYILAAGKRDSFVIRFAYGVILVVSIFATLAPWAFRNFHATGHWVFTTLWVGPSLYDGLNPDATGDSDMRFYDADPQVPKMSEYEVDRYFRGKSWEFVRGNPGRALELTAIKLWRFWKPWPNAAQFGGILPMMVVALSFVPLLLFALWGAWICRGRFWMLFFTAGPIVYFSAIHMVFLGSLRYRLPVEYPLCVLSAVGAQNAWKMWRKNPVADQ